MMKIIKHISRLLSICARKPNLIRRTLRPKCGAGAPTFLSAVYNRGTQAKKRQADVPQCGRSMIEMLGVLAIVGVLSVGSIAGYSKAMQRYLLNRQADQYTHILNAINSNYDMLNPHKFFSSSTSLVQPFITFGFVPADMIQSNGYTLQDVFKNKVDIAGRPTYILINIEIGGSKKYDQCMNLYQTLKPFTPLLRQATMTLNFHGSFNVYGDKRCPSSYCLKTISLSELSQTCRVCDNSGTCRFYIYID